MKGKATFGFYIVIIVHVSQRADIPTIPSGSNSKFQLAPFWCFPDKRLIVAVTQCSLAVFPLSAGRCCPLLRGPAH